VFDPELIAGQVIAVVAERLWTFLLLAFRVVIVFAIAPWPGRMVPVRVRGFLAISVAMVITPTLGADALTPATGTAVVIGVISEAVYASAIGFAMWMAVGAITTCGQVGGLQMGFGLRGAMDPASGSSMNAVARIAFLAWVPMALELGMHHHILRAMAIAPTTIAPADAVPLIDRATLLAQASLDGGARMFALALVGAGPVFGMSLLSYAGLGAISRAVPNAMIIGEALGGAAMLGMFAVGVSALSWPSITDTTLAPLVEALAR